MISRLNLILTLVKSGVCIIIMPFSNLSERDGATGRFSADAGGFGGVYER